jgi:hypothetical protein
MMSWYLDSETGEVIPHSADNSWDDGNEEFDPEDDRYIFIEPLTTHDAFRIMRDFLLQLSPRADKCRNSLECALEGRHPFRSFKDVLSDWPDERGQWFAYHGSCLIKHAARWLHFKEIEPTPRPPVESLGLISPPK